MNIGFIEDTHLHGGTQIWVAEAARAFLDHDQEVTLLAPESSWVVEQCRKTGAAITTYDWDGVVRQDAQSRQVWTEALSRCDVAVCTVHPPRHGFHCSVFAGRCIREGGLKTHLIPKTGTIVPDYLCEFYLPDESINCSVIAIADFTRKYLVEHYKIPAEKVALVYQGTDADRFKHSDDAQKEARLRYPLPENASPILASIGSFEHRKGHPILFEAMQELVNGSLPDAHLMMVGDGPDETMLKELAGTLGIEGSVTFFPFTDEPNYIYERLDMTVLPSLFKEGLPNVLLESMAMGVPVVSSNIGGVSEIVMDGETGYMVEPGDKSALADGIRKVWEDQHNYRAMKTRSRKLIEEQFDKTIQFKRFLAHFKTLLSPD